MKCQTDAMKPSLLVALLAGAAFAEPRRPVIVYRVSHHDVRPLTGKPWEQTAALPQLVAYDDGLVLVTFDGDTRSVTLPEPERTALFASVGDAFFTLKDAYEGTREMHPPVHLVTRWKGDVRKTVRFSGSVHEPAQRVGPPSLLLAIDALSAWTHQDLAAWAPEALSVRACQTKAASVVKRWPAGWPLPEQGQKGLAPNCFTVRVPGTEKKRAEALVPKGKAFTTIQQAGVSWLVTLERFALPAEEMWEGS